MGRAGRYTLSVMVWIATYAGWSSILGIVVAAVTRQELSTGDIVGTKVSVGVSLLFQVLVPLLPTLVALWFNDWARDGFPTREQRRTAPAGAAVRTAGTARGADVGVGSGEGDATGSGDADADAGATGSGAGSAGDAGSAPEPPVPAETGPAVGRKATEDKPAPARGRPPDIAPPAEAVVFPAPLGVPDMPHPVAASDTPYPVAPLLRDE